MYYQRDLPAGGPLFLSGGGLLEARDIRFAYRPGGIADGPHFAVDGASLCIAPGEVVALVGLNGCGKSTLARALCGSLPLQDGEVMLDGELAAPRELRLAVGYVRQDPKSQIVAPTVFDEVAFGPANLGLPADEIRERVTAVLEACGLADKAAAGTDSLSGGELQRLALAGILVMQPRYLVLDEAAAMLDGRNSEWVRGVARDFASKGGGVLLVTHDADDVLSADRVIAMERGRITWEGLPADAVEVRDVVTCGSWAGAREAIHTPTGSSLFGADESSGRPASIASCAFSSSSFGVSQTQRTVSCGESQRTRGLVASDVCVSADGCELLSGINLVACAGCVTLVTGPSGAGKTTLARVLSGVLPPDSGNVCLSGMDAGSKLWTHVAEDGSVVSDAQGSSRLVRPGMVGLCLQRPEDQFVRPTVLEDVALAPLNLGAGADEALTKAREVLSWLGVPERLWNASPWSLSGGEARLAAIAGAVALDAPAIVLDEPTAGLDVAASERIASLARELTDRGKVVVVVSHDLGLWLPVADETVLLNAGHVTWHGAAASLLKDSAPLEQAGLAVPSPYHIRKGLRRGEAS